MKLRNAIIISFVAIVICIPTLYLSLSSIYGRDYGVFVSALFLLIVIAILIVEVTARLRLGIIR